MTQDEKKNKLLNILVAEDDSICKRFIEFIFKKKEHNINYVENGLEAVKLFEQNPFDLVLMDIQMPVMDGITATKRIRQMDQGKDTVILATTAYSDQLDAGSWSMAGMDGVLDKPIKKNELLTLVEQLACKKAESGLN